MGKADVAVNRWLEDNERFASLCNGVVFGGQQVIKPEELENLDRETDILLADKGGKTKGMERRRDIIKRWKKGADLAILACESQDKIHYAMPVRCMLYDGVTYTDQIRELRRRYGKNRKEKESQSLTAEEYLSGFRKDDVIYPVITLVFYYNEKKWDGAVDLYGMFADDGDREIKDALRKCIPNYRMNLIDAGHMEEAYLKKFSEDLQQVLGMLKYRKQKRELQKYIQKNEAYFSSVDVETYQALCSFLNMEKGLKEVKELQKEEKINMCQAMEEWYQDAVEEGITLAKTIFRLSAQGRSEQEIAEETGISPGEVKAILQ